jgi:hypothetical protein
MLKNEKQRVWGDRIDEEFEDARQKASRRLKEEQREYPGSS